MKQRQLIIVGATALAYYGLFQLNLLLFSFAGYSTGVSWVYLPSGLRLVFILLFVELGALGIVLASAVISFNQYFSTDYITALGASLISGFAPWLARLICIDQLKLHSQLDQLTPGILVKTAIVFSVLSATMHQLLYSWSGHTENFLKSTSVMALGDLVGAIVMLYLAKLCLHWLPVPDKKDS